MKKLNLVLGLAFAAMVTFGFTPSFAQDMGEDQGQTEQPDAATQNDQVTEITVDELPDAVSQAWDQNKAEGDEVSKVYKITSADGTERYRIEYVDGSSQSQYLEYDAEGNEI